MPRRRLPSTGLKKNNPNSLFASLRNICGRNFNAVTAINFIVMIAYYLIFLTGTIYVRETYSASLSFAGFTSGIMVIGCLVGRFFCGNLIAFISCKILLMGGIVFFLGTLLALFQITSLELLFIDRFLTGFGSGIINTVTATVAACAIPPQDRGFGISFFSLSTMLALALGPYAGFTLIAEYGYFATLRMTLVSVALTLFLALLVKNPQGIVHKLRPLMELKSYIDVRVIPFGTVALIVFLGYGTLQAFMASFARERNLSAVAGIFFLVYACAALLSRPFTGRKMDLHGENKIIYPLMGIILAAFTLLAFAHSKIIFLFCAILLGIGLGNFQSIGHAVSLSLVTPTRYAQATSTYYILMDFGIGIGSYIFGFIVPYYGYTGMFLALSATIILATILYAYLHGRHVRYS